MEQFLNRIRLRGEMEELPEYSHENHGRKFYRFYLNVQRLSGAVDRLPILASLSLLETVDLSAGGKLLIEGQVRSHNHTDESGRHLMIFVFAESITAEDGADENTLTVSGPLCREPNYRQTPLGREICDIMLAVPRAYHRADYLPCILWGKTAQMGAQCHTREQIEIMGRLQSRIYTKYIDNQLQERTAYEISALTAHPCADDNIIDTANSLQSI